ncbi:MAG: trypsin-like peptidase domain-containing protein [Pirellulaceae bacterium]|nr:trypsin-like peptidase domain-containing protein [Pirellulaceae bacterium]
MKHLVQTVRSVALLVLLASLPLNVFAQEAAKTDTTLARVKNGNAPSDVSELRALQTKIRELTESMLSATVAVQVGRANGSGVIVSEDGYVLTAAHVAGTPRRAAMIFLSDGRIVRGITLGLNQELDAGMIKITESGQWPHADLGNSAAVKPGQWCLATGHPGGYDRDRLPVLRWGRILKTENSAILTDCTLVGGDSGGPLFDLEGKVIGIHSRIGKNLTINVHVPVDPFRNSWTRLAKGEVWGLLTAPERGWLGVTEDTETERARISQVIEGSPAASSGLETGDIVLRVNTARIETFQDLQNEVGQLSPEDEVQIRVVRDGQVLDFELKLGTRPRRRN